MHLNFTANSFVFWCINRENAHRTFLWTVATSLVALRWLCDSPWTGCARRTKNMYVARTSNNRVIPMEWSWWVTSNYACEPGEQLIVLANGDDESVLVRWSLLMLAAMVWSFAHMPLRISDRNRTLLAENFQNVSELNSKHLCFWTHKLWKCTQNFFC